MFWIQFPKNFFHLLGKVGHRRVLLLTVFPNSGTSSSRRGRVGKHSFQIMTQDGTFIKNKTLYFSDEIIKVMWFI